jgi:hypothetical protein
MKAIPTKSFWTCAEEQACGVNRIIKERDRDEPYIPRQKVQESDDDPGAWHCGHFRPRGSMATGFDPGNAHKQCAYDNIYPRLLASTAIRRESRSGWHRI